MYVLLRYTCCTSFECVNIAPISPSFPSEMKACPMHTYVYCVLYMANFSCTMYVFHFFPLYSEALVRTGFQSLQLVMADFLPALPPSCVPICVEVIGQYGLQKMDINISLTSVGLLVRENIINNSQGSSFLRTCTVYP